MSLALWATLFSTLDLSIVEGLPAFPDSPQPSLLLPLLRGGTNLNQSLQGPQLNQTTNVSGYEDVRIRCYGPLFGDLSGDSCRQAWEDIPTFPDVEYTFGTRGETSADVPLPFRFISRDGTCSIEIDQTIADRAITETALSSEIGDVAWDLLNECTFYEHPRGGIATGLGLKSQLTLTVGSFKPKVMCGHQQSILATSLIRPCQDALNMMPASKTPQSSGAVRGAQVQLPKTFPDTASRCAVIVDIMRGPAVEVKWYDLWASAVSIVGMCTVNSQPGRSYHTVDNTVFSISVKIASSMGTLRNSEA